MARFTLKRLMLSVTLIAAGIGLLSTRSGMSRLEWVAAEYLLGLGVLCLMTWPIFLTCATGLAILLPASLISPDAPGLRLVFILAAVFLMIFIFVLTQRKQFAAYSLDTTGPNVSPLENRSMEKSPV
jgi:hypothetical protein